jgi:hypothetical protein
MNERPWLTGDWIQTYTGRQFWPTNPSAFDIDIRDIAHALSMMCRYSGHCTSFYSVAEHCVFVSHNVPEKYALWGLLHDASEAYLVDVPRPIKPALTNYLELEERLMRAVIAKFNLEFVLPMPASVKAADTAILFDERDQNLRKPPKAWTDEGTKRLGVTLQFWQPHVAETMFMRRFEELAGPRENFFAAELGAA